MPHPALSSYIQECQSTMSHPNWHLLTRRFTLQQCILVIELFVLVGVEFLSLSETNDFFCTGLWSFCSRFGTDGRRSLNIRQLWFNYD